MILVMVNFGHYTTTDKEGLQVRTLKRMISRYMQIISLMIVVVTMLIVVLIQFLNEQHRARESAELTFYQMEQVLIENQQELEEVEEEYRQTCLHNAQTIAYILERSPELLDDMKALEEIAGSVEVDEIHIFDKSGCIIAGTHPEYFGLTVDSGEQISFFKPLLTDKSLQLVQDIEPNTAEAKLMQYSALWSENGEFIVQVGMEPIRVMEATEKNELSYIFSLLRVNAEAEYYAIDAVSGEIVGSTIMSDVGRDCEDVGFKLGEIQKDEDGFHETVNGIVYFCVFKQMGSNYIGRMLPNSSLYKQVPINALVLGVCLILVAQVLVRVVTGYMNKYVVGGIYSVNNKLRAISKGDLDARVDVQSSVEFAELSIHVNDMVQSIMDNNRKMSYILSKTNMYIGVYEYNLWNKKVRFTEYVPQILRLSEEETAKMTDDYAVLRAYIDLVWQNPVSGEEDIYKLPGTEEYYVRLEEIVEKNQVFGAVIDVTDEMCKLKKAEGERDVDAMTGLYNRRGLEHHLEKLYECPGELGWNAVIMLDADGLKWINDTYGHDKGDVYLKKIAGVINNFGIKSSLSSRLGGDEFVLFLYEYDDEKELLNTIRTLEYVQNNSSAKLGENISVPLNFSIGYCMGEGPQDYQKQLKIADERMYENKRQRKAQRK